MAAQQFYFTRNTLTLLLPTKDTNMSHHQKSTLSTEQIDKYLYSIILHLDFPYHANEKNSILLPVLVLDFLLYVSHILLGDIPL
jgi:hypothetical protein